MIVTHGLGSSLLITQGYGSIGEPETPPQTGGGYAVPGLRWRKKERKRKIVEDDQELMEMLMAIMPILN